LICNIIKLSIFRQFFYSKESKKDNVIIIFEAFNKPDIIIERYQERQNYEG